MRKRFLLLCTLCVLFLTACGNSNSQNQNTTSGQTQSSVKTENSISSESAETAPKEEKDNSESRILIAYFTAAENSSIAEIPLFFMNYSL